MKTTILFALCLCACATTVPRKTVQLQAGIRVVENCTGNELSPTPQCNCKQPPKVYEGVAKRFDETCMFVEGGPASCTYIGRVDFGRSWACGIGMRQDSCTDEWKPVEMPCTIWDERYFPLIPHWGDENSESK